MLEAPVGRIAWGAHEEPIPASFKIWLARSLAGETSATESGRAAAAWAMAQRFAYYRDQGHATTAGMPCSRAPTGRGIAELEPVTGPLDLTAMVRCFSSPVNPYQTDRVPSRQARRRFLIQASLDALEERSPGIGDFVDRFVRGEVPNPVPRAADFDDPDEVPPGALVLYRIGGNVFMPEPGERDRGSMLWPDHYVRILPPKKRRWWLWLGLGAGAAAAAVGALRRAR